MENAIRIAGDIVDACRGTLAPETTEGQGRLHPSDRHFRRDGEGHHGLHHPRLHREEGCKTKEALLEGIAKEVMKAYPGSSYTVTVKEQYRNMKVVIDQHPEIVEYAIEAIRRAGMTPVRGWIRGGTDGSRLSFMGLPCANIFAGEHAFHSPLECVSRQDMEKAAKTIVHLAMIWEERA